METNVVPCVDTNTKLVLSEFDALVELDYPVGLNLPTNLETIIYLVRKLKEEIERYYAPNLPVVLWCTGSSGTIVAGIASTIIPNCIIHYIRKDQEFAHTYGTINCWKDDGSQINVFIDDFIASGSTLRRVYYEFIKHKGSPTFVSDTPENTKFDIIAVTGWVRPSVTSLTKHLICQKYIR